MKTIVYLSLLAVMFITGCSGMSAQEEPATRQILSKDGNFFVWEHLDRHYVIGSEASNAKFKKSPHLPYAKTILGAGPSGETVVYEINKKDGAYAERLMDTYEKTPFLVESKGDNYFVYKVHGRYYVVGNEATRDKLVKNGHIPYAKTILGAGPNGETVVFEIDKKEPELTEKLMKMFK